jgi:hypothetical protein
MGMFLLKGLDVEVLGVAMHTINSLRLDTPCLKGSVINRVNYCFLKLTSEIITSRIIEQSAFKCEQ